MTPPPPLLATTPCPSSAPADRTVRGSGAAAGRRARPWARLGRRVPVRIAPVHAGPDRVADSGPSHRQLWRGRPAHRATAVDATSGSWAGNGHDPAEDPAVDLRMGLAVNAATVGEGQAELDRPRHQIGAVHRPHTGPLVTGVGPPLGPAHTARPSALGERGMTPTCTTTVTSPDWMTANDSVPATRWREVRGGWGARRSAWVRAAVGIGYVATIVAANWTSTHCPPLAVGTLLVPAGTLWAGATFTARDVVHETTNYCGVLAAIAVGGAVSWCLASPHIAVASVLAFATSELIGSLAYSRLRGRSVLGAVTVSNLAGLGIDSVLFVPVAFGGFALVPGQLLGKTVATVLTVAALIAAKAARRAVRR
jgi:queuosine precursor transporter